MTLIMLYDFLKGSTQQKETSYQGWLFFYSYAIYYNLFIGKIGIKA
jgi:hypothetical protein